jgi:branched-subunit amino acid aminotransferase/4-amino-4-deoxychorismate lyase
MKQIVFLNGAFLNLNEAKLPVFSPGFLWGLGLFETMRAYNNRIVYLKEHLKRIKGSSGLVGIELLYSSGELKKIIQKTLALNSIKDAYVRLTLWKSEKRADILVAAKKFNSPSAKKYKTGFRAGVSGIRQDENSFLAKIKSTNRILYELSYRQAKSRGFDEAIIMNNRGYIAEGSRCNIFFSKENEIFTPALSCGCLPGITRRAIFDLAQKYSLRVFEGNFTLRDLSEAEEAFLTNSLIGVMPLSCVEQKNIGKSGCGKLTRFFIERYTSLLR